MTLITLKKCMYEKIDMLRSMTASNYRRKKHKIIEVWCPFSGRGRGEGYYQRGSYDDDGYGRGRARGDVWDDGRDKRFERGFPPRPGFDDGPTSPRRELSRSMSSENWRDTKKDDDDDGDWRRAGPKERWG